MSIVSNRYTTRAFSEHPIASWPLDDEVYFLSLISVANQDLTTWDTEKCSVTTTEIFSISEAAPFKNDPKYYIIGDHTQITTTTNIEIFQSDIFQLNSLNESMQTIHMNLYLYQDSIYANYYEIGYRYFDTTELMVKEVSHNVLASPKKQWINLYHTFNINQFDSETVEIFIKVNVNSGGTTNDYNFVVNGLSLGQWSESHSWKNLGSIPQLLPASTQLVSTYGLPSEQYGPLSDNAYYIVENGKLLAKNNSIPLVYGSENATSLYPTDTNLPSFIFPGKNFLSEDGRYATFTLEFWTKINSNTKEQRKIFGSIDSNDGIYISEGFISLVYGNQIRSHNVQNWYRPMLVHLIYTSSKISLMINAEQVAEIITDQNQLVLSSTNEWLGFYTYPDIDLFQIDCISIYPYEVPVAVAKRRFVWGQGVESQEVIDSSFKGKTASINFNNAGYATNLIYPDKERWDAGSYNNLTATTSLLGMPNYSLPNIFLSGRDVNIWYQDNKKVNDVEYIVEHPKFFTFRPNLNQAETEWQLTGANWNEKCYLQFSAANILTSPISSIYAVFELKEDIEEDRPLFHIVNSLNGKRFEVNINSYIVSYKYNGIELFSVDTSLQEHVVAGIHIQSLAQNFGYDLASFFSSYENLEIYIGGAPDTSTTIYETFEGKIYQVSFANADNHNLINDHFTSSGFAEYDSEDLLTHYATYTLKPFEKYGKFFLDISVASYWEEYFPLMYFAKYINLNDSTNYYDFDFLQFNIGYPSYFEKETVIVPETTYEQIYNNQIKLKNIDFSKSSIKMFATFQLLAEGANEPIENFPYTKQLTSTHVIDAPLENTNLDPYKAYKTKFSIKDGVIIYPPKNISIEDTALVIHLVINHDCIITNPIQIRNLEISSRALDFNGNNPIGTKFGKNIFAYTKNGIYFNYKSKNPILINKENYPYLYLTNNSGIESLNKKILNQDSGIIVPINEFKEESYFIAAMQLFLKNNIEDNISIPIPIFDIDSLNDKISVVIVSDNSQERYILKAIDKNTNLPYNNLIFYKNGIRASEIYIEKQEWNCISLLFDTPLEYSSYTGSATLYHGLTFNNISYFASQGLDEISSVIPRVWSEVLYNSPENNFGWGYWYGTFGENIISNTSFETNASNYSSPQTLSLNTNPLYSYQGDNSAKIVISNISNTEVISLNSGNAAQSGDSYLVTAKFFVNAGSPLAGKTITISGEDGSGYTNSSDQLVSPTLIAGEWVVAKRKIIMSSTTMPKISAELNDTTGTSAAELYTDDWRIEKIIDAATINQWRNMYVLDFGQEYSLTPQDIFASYTGTNNEIVDDNFGIAVENDLFTSFSEILWYSTSGKPA